jgi:3-hydroxyisobutyrate dehydrogenase-like beta-hydroxyacid dehydrogenase
MKLGFSGLGVMGLPIARNLLKSGHPMHVVARRSTHFEELRSLGATTSTDAAPLAGADVLFACLPDERATEQLLFGEDGAARLLARGAMVVDLSTSDHGATLAIAKRLAESGIEFIDAPISGMEARAIAGTLTVMVGGDAANLERVRPLFERMANRIVHVGKIGNGQLIKLVNQLLFDINAAAIAEILPMAVKLGLDARQVGEVVNSGTGRSYASEYFIPRILEGDFSTGYAMQAAYKDLVAGARIGAEHTLPLPVLAAATATYQTALRRGYGADDKGGMIQVFEDLLGVSFRA